VRGEGGVFAYKQLGCGLGTSAMLSRGCGLGERGGGAGCIQHLLLYNQGSCMSCSMQPIRNSAFYIVVAPDE
jgi:hypothetical protein